MNEVDSSGTPSGRPKRQAAQAARARYTQTVHHGFSDGSSEGGGDRKVPSNPKGNTKSKAKARDEDFLDNGSDDEFVLADQAGTSRGKAAASDDDEELNAISESGSEELDEAEEDVYDGVDTPPPRTRKGKINVKNTRINAVVTMAPSVAARKTKPVAADNDVSNIAAAQRGSLWIKAKEGRNLSMFTSSCLLPSVKVEHAPWPLDGAAMLTGASWEIECNAKLKVGRWNEELWRPPRGKMGDYGWLPGKDNSLDGIEGRAKVEPMDEDLEPRIQPHWLQSIKVLSEEEVLRRRTEALAEAGNAQTPNATDVAASSGIDPMAIDPSLQDGEEDITLLATLQPWFTAEGDLRIAYGSDTVLKRHTLAPGAAHAADGLEADSDVHFFNTGGYNYCVEACPRGLNVAGNEFLAVSTSFERAPRNRYGIRLTEPAPAQIQIWSIAPGRGGNDNHSKVRLEMVLHIDTGSAWQLQWRPLAYRDLEQPPPSNEILGVLAAACMNGKLCFFQVPHPNELRHVKKSKSAAPLQIALKPILSLDLFETVPHCLDWAFPERILVGCSNGYAAVWDLEELLSGNGQQQAPLHYFRTQETAITGVRWHMHPNTDARGRPAWNEMPNLFTSCSLMGSIALTDLTDPYHQADIRFGQSGGSISGVPAYDLAFSTHANAAIIEGNLYGVDLFFFTNPHFGRKARVAEHRAPTLAIATSDYHPLLATGSADGSVRMVNIWRNLSKRGAKASVQLFRLTCGTESSELRVLDYFLPDILNPHRIPGTSFDWPPEVAITDVAWSRHINRGYLLASVSASGLGRIQWVGEAPHKER